MCFKFQVECDHRSHSPATVHRSYRKSCPSSLPLPHALLAHWRAYFVITQKQATVKNRTRAQIILAEKKLPFWQSCHREFLLNSVPERLAALLAQWMQGLVKSRPCHVVKFDLVTPTPCSNWLSGEFDFCTRETVAVCLSSAKLVLV